MMKSKKATSNDLDRLRAERKVLRGVSEQLTDQGHGFGVPLDNKKGSVRRGLVQAILEICAHPDQHVVNSDLILAAYLVQSFGDVAASAIITDVADSHYLKCIQHAKKGLGHK